MISGSGEKMQCTYLPRYYDSLDNNAGASGSLWQPLNNGVTYKGGMACNVLLEPHSSHLYNKEILRLTILKHEGIFRNQVQELHRLYLRQRELMDEIKMREMSQYNNLQMQPSNSNLTLSQMQCTISQKALQSPSGLFLHNGDGKPSAQGVMNFQGPSTFVSKKSVQAGSDSYLEENYLEEHKVSSFKSQDCRKRMLDLELPAEEYVDSEEEEHEHLGKENSVEVPQVESDPSKSDLESPPKIDVELKERPSSNFNSSCSKSTYLFDLNESIQFDESATPNSTSFVDSSNTYSMDFMHQDQDLSGKSTTKSPVLNEEITYNILVTKGNEGSCLNSDLQLSLAGKPPLPCDYSTSMCQEFTKSDNELIDNNHQSMYSSCISNSCPLVPSPDEAKTEASSSVSSQRTSFRNSREIPIAIQALPCFNAPEFLQTSRSSPSSSGIKRKYTHLMRNPACFLSPGSIITCVTRNSRSKSDAECHPVAKSYKDMKHGEKTSVVVDLNVMPQSCLPVSEENFRSINGKNLFDDSLGHFDRSKVEPDYDGEFVSSPKTPNSSNQFPALTSYTSQTKSSKGKDILNSENAGAISSSLAYNSSEESDAYYKDNFIIANKIGEELSKSKTCVHLDDFIKEHHVPSAATQMIDKKAIGTNLEAPISPDNQEKSPPRGESEDNKIEMPLHISKQKIGELYEDVDRIAAETIISISFSAVQECLKNANSGLLEASSDCLNWFAGIVSCVPRDLGKEFERLLNDAPGFDHNVVAPGGNGQLRGTQVEDHCSETTKQKYKRILGISLPSERERGQVRNARQRKQFQSGLPCISSPSSCKVTENLQSIERLITAGNTPGTVSSRKKVRRNGHARGNRQCTAFYTNLMDRRVCSLLKQRTSETGCSFLLRCLQDGWGKKKRRQKSPRAQSLHQ